MNPVELEEAVVYDELSVLYSIFNPTTAVLFAKLPAGEFVVFVSHGPTLTSIVVGPGVNNISVGALAFVVVHSGSVPEA